MDNLIEDAVSIFMQILMHFAPDRIETFEFQLSGYIFACAFVLLTMWALYKLFSSFATVALQWLSRGW